MRTRFFAEALAVLACIAITGCAGPTGTVDAVWNMGTPAPKTGPLYTGTLEFFDSGGRQVAVLDTENDPRQIPLGVYQVRGQLFTQYWSILAGEPGPNHLIRGPLFTTCENQIEVVADKPTAVSLTRVGDACFVEVLRPAVVLA